MIDCKKIVDEIKEDLKNEAKLKKRCLAIIMIGNNRASLNYVKGKLSDCEEIGIESRLFKLDEFCTYDEIKDKILELNNDKTVNGIILQLPLPNHLKDFTTQLTNLISKEKDVDGFRVDSPFTPCTPMGVMLLLNKLNVDLKGKRVCLLGKGRLVGRPLIPLLLNQNATLTICDSNTSELDKIEFLSNSDIIITATGKHGSLKSTWLNPNQIVIDCGISIITGKQYGDCDEDVYKRVKNVTPRIKGMGLFTRICLLMNVLCTNQS